jgi:nitrogen fixation NifU-like protein
MAESHEEERSLDTLYRDVLFEHYRHPHHKGVIPDAQIVTQGHNPLCGDRITVFGKFDDAGRLSPLHFDGKACAICTASASMMTDLLQGKGLAEALEWADKFKTMMRDETPFEAPAEVPDLEALAGVKKFPVRVKCATLPWTTLKEGLLGYQAGQGRGATQQNCSTQEGA